MVANNTQDRIICEAIETFDLAEFDKLTNIKRKAYDQRGRLFIGDTFECDLAMVKYLTGENAKNKVVAKVVEVIPKIEKLKKKNSKK